MHHAMDATLQRDGIPIVTINCITQTLWHPSPYASFPFTLPHAPAPSHPPLPHTRKRKPTTCSRTHASTHSRSLVPSPPPTPRTYARAHARTHLCTRKIMQEVKWVDCGLGGVRMPAGSGRGSSPTGIHAAEVGRKGPSVLRPHCLNRLAPAESRGPGQREGPRLPGH